RPRLRSSSSLANSPPVVPRPRGADRPDMRRYATKILRSEQRLEDRYVLAGAFIVPCILTFAFAGDGRGGRMGTGALEGVTLIVILRASQVRPGTVRIAGIICGGLFLVVALAQSSDSDWARAAPAIAGALLAFCGPIAIIRQLVRQPQINFT